MTVPPLASVRSSAPKEEDEPYRDATARKIVSSVAQTQGITETSAHGQISWLYQQYAPLAYQMPWQVLDYVEILAQYNPDYSQAVDNIRTLANSGHNLFVTAGSDLRQRVIKEILEEKARMIQDRHGGIDGLIDKLLKQAAVYGAMCGEWVLNEDLTDVVDFVDVNPKSIRFFWGETEQRWLPFQKVSMQAAAEAKKAGQEVRNMNCIRLNEVTFNYFAFDAAPGFPYGTPPFLASLANIAIQRDMNWNMAQIMKKMGLIAMFDVSLEPLKKRSDESRETFAARSQQYLNDFANAFHDAVTDGGAVHYNDAAVEMLQVAGNGAGATNLHKQNEEQVFSGLKSMPSVQGRCLDPNTRILMADGSSKELAEIESGDLLQGFDEHTDASRRRWRIAKVENIWEIKKRSLRLHLSDGRQVVCSDDHPFLMQKQNAGLLKTHRTTGSSSARADAARKAAEARWDHTEDEFVGTDWKRAKDIRTGEWIKALNEPLDINFESDDYKAGYVAGVGTGDGCWRHPDTGRSYWQLAMQISDDVVLDRVEAYGSDLGIDQEMWCWNIREPNLHPSGSSFAGTQQMQVLRMNRQEQVKVLISFDDERETNDYRAGWLAGMFDTDGSRHKRDRGREQIRFCQKDGPAKDRIERYLSDLGFATTRHRQWIEVVGDRLEKWRLTASLHPALDRKVVRLEDHTVRTFKPVRVERVEVLGVRRLIDITTTTSTFVGNGLLTHNSYSTTETYAGVAYDIIIRNTFKYQRAVKRMIEAGYWLMATLRGEQPQKIQINFKSNKSVQRLQDAQAHRQEILNALMLWMSGFTNQTGAGQMLGFSDPVTPMDTAPADLLIRPAAAAKSLETGDRLSGEPVERSHDDDDDEEGLEA